MDALGRMVAFLSLASWIAPSMFVDSLQAQMVPDVSRPTKSSQSELSAHVAPRADKAVPASSPFGVRPVSSRTLVTQSATRDLSAAAPVTAETEFGAPETEGENSTLLNDEEEAVGEESEGEENGDDEEEAEEAETADEAVAALLGDRWHQAGPFTAEYLYTGEVFTNAHGGISTKQATRYRGNLDLTLTMDTGKAGWWDGGEFSVYAQHSHGQTLTQNFVGDGQYYSSIDTGLNQGLTQLAEYWYQHILEEEWWIKLGRQDANENFAFADLGGDFINSSFITLANIPLPTWPYQTLGVSSLYQPTSTLRLGGGVYDHGRDFGQWWSTTESRGMFFIGQADYQPWADVEDALLTLIRVGVWYTNSDTVAVDGGGVFEENYGGYATLDRMLFTEYEDPAQGLGAFLQFSWAPQDRNQVDVNYGAGLVYRGLLPCRNEDTVGVGLSVIDFSPVLGSLTGQTYENALEVFYKARLGNGFNIQPDLQYIARPNGIQRDAFVAGLRFEANF